MPAMIQFTGHYYDGRSATALAVEAWVVASTDSDRLEIRVIGEGVDINAPVQDLRLSDRLGQIARFVRLPNGATLETNDNDAVDALLSHQRQSAGSTIGRWVNHLERSWFIALIALASTVVAIWAAITLGIPAAAEQVANQVPPEMESQMGSEALSLLDRQILRPTELPDAQVARVQALFESLNDDPSITLELRHAPRIGANALALPSGIVVVTDDLVLLAENDDELAAVIAHELGHVRHRHIMRSLIQNSTTALLVATLVGDLSSVAGLSATLPTFLMEAKHSRDFEREADRHAAEVMAASGRDLNALTSILKRLDASAGGESDDPTDRLIGYLSSHPATSERIEALEALAKELR